MVSTRRRSLIRAMLAAGGLAVSRGARAEALPPGPMRIIVPNPTGDSTDVMCRLVGESIRSDTGRVVAVENRAGGGGMIAAAALAQARPDGLTIGMLVTPHITQQTLYKRLDILKDFKPIGRLYSSAFAVVVAPGSPYATVDALLRATVEAPNKLTYGSGGVGSSAHFCIELLRGRIEGFAPVHVPFRGAIESAAAAAAGQVDCSIGVIGSMLPLINGGKLRALAITAAGRDAGLPGVPTLAERIPDFVHRAFAGFAAPAATPADAVSALYGLLRSAAAKPQVLRYAASASGVVEASASPEAFAAEIRAEIEIQHKLIRQYGIQPST